MRKPTPIIVAVGTADSDAALQYAAREALLVDAPLHLVHVLQIPGKDALAAGVYQDLLTESTAILARAEERARTLTDGRVSVTTELRDHSPTSAGLVGSTQHAQQIVLQHRHLSPARRFFAASTVCGVAARAQVPVVVVPADWHPGAARRPVVAAVQDGLEAPAVLRSAYDEAERRGAEVVILHAWWLSSGFDVVAVDDDYRQQRAAEFEHELTSIMEAMADEWADVDATVAVVHAPPVEALLDWAERSELLVIGRRHHLLPFGSHLGPVARAVIHHSGCPVLVAPEAPAEPSPVSRLVKQRYQPGVMY
jgi:nucleotide-binding universal stress UspA family protein